MGEGTSSGSLDPPLLSCRRLETPWNPRVGVNQGGRSHPKIHRPVQGCVSFIQSLFTSSIFQLQVAAVPPSPAASRCRIHRTESTPALLYPKLPSPDTPPGNTPAHIACFPAGVPPLLPELKTDSGEGGSRGQPEEGHMSLNCVLR